jgi:beta-lactamase regulating signal transducer with metallopeptidase domain
MTPILYVIHSVSVVAADFLVASIWQGMVVAGCVAVLLRLLPDLTAAVRSTIWTAVLLMVVLFPSLSLALHSRQASTWTHAELLHASDTWCLALLIVWVVFSVFRASQLLASAFLLQNLAGRAVAVTPSESVASLLRSSNRRVELCASAEVHRPSIAGFFHPRILLSPALLATLSAAELEQVVLHEMEHLRRYDDWTNLLQKLSLALVPLHPVLLWLDRQMCLERELACDDRVLRQTRARKAYAACLARLAEDSMVRRGFSLTLEALGSRGRRSELVGRVYRILRAPETRMSRERIWLATAVLLVAAFAGAAELSRSPQLIRFTPAARPQGMSVPRIEATGFQTLTARPALVKAVVPECRPFSIAPAVMRVRKSTHRVRLAGNNRPSGNAASGPYFSVTTWTPVTMHSTLTMAITEDSQFLYAAVPAGNGWLIIQL